MNLPTVRPGFLDSKITVTVGPLRENYVIGRQVDLPAFAPLDEGTHHLILMI